MILIIMIMIVITIIIMIMINMLYAGTSDCFTHLRALLVLQAPRHWPYLASVTVGQSCPSDADAQR